jgi:hypothetical protein
MLQIKTFALPGEEAAANEFLKTHKPAGDISYNNSQLFVAWDDGTYPIEHQIADYRELLQSQANARVQQEIALNVMKYQLAGVPTNMARYDEISNSIKAQQEALDLQDAKTEYVKGRIATLEAQLAAQ